MLPTPRPSGADKPVRTLPPVDESNQFRLVSVSTDVLRRLERLRVPVQDLTPEGLVGFPFHLVALTVDQRDVLESWQVEVNDVTPDVLETASDLVPHLRTLQRAPRSPRIIAPPARRTAASSRPDQLPAWRHTSARDTEVPVPTVEEPAPRADAASSPPVETPRAVPPRYRVSIGGKYREATLDNGKILLDGRAFDSPGDAVKSLAAAERDWVFWEHFDPQTNRWRIVEGEWQPTVG